MELLDVYNEEGKVTGRIVTRGDKSAIFNEGEHIAIAQIYIENDEGKFLIEKSSKVNGYRLLPTGGHISSGETPLETIIRETKEEIGLDISKDEIIDLGFMIVDKPVRFIFYIKKNVNLDELKLQTEEVEGVIYMTADEIREAIADGRMHGAHNYILDRVLNYTNKHKKM